MSKKSNLWTGFQAMNTKHSTIRPALTIQIPDKSKIQNPALFYIYSKKIQWGSETRTSLDFKWSKKGWVANGLDFEWDLKFGTPTI